MINRKIGNCSTCSATDTYVVKIAKDLYCDKCNRTQKAKQYMAKQKERNRTRSLIVAPEVSGELQRWFEDRRKEMVGVCANCGGKSCRDDKYYKFSLAHILPKAYFESVATHPDNFIELCFFGESCHTNHDNGMLDLIDMNCFDTIIKKFAAMYPFIAQDEKRRIPAVLMEYLKTEI